MAHDIVQTSAIVLKLKDLWYKMSAETTCCLSRTFKLIIMQLA